MRTSAILLYVTLSFWTAYLPVIHFWWSILAFHITPFFFNSHLLSFSGHTIEQEVWSSRTAPAHADSTSCYGPAYRSALTLVPHLDILWGLSCHVHPDFSYHPDLS
ncbi:hypothetical protein BJV78DRAFT_488881 [Lactifluus subvellereus]|nr:hypothetical protein BJV78DRAFT_488881 [Lactifluus subvellereus]